MKKILLSIYYCMIVCSSIAQNRDSIFIVQYVRDSFTKYGIPNVYVTLTDTCGILIDNLWTENGNGSHDAKIWGKYLARRSQTICVRAEHPDYETSIQRLEIKTPGRLLEYKFPDLLMKRKIKESALDEVMVTATRVQLAYRGDTIVIDAGAFRIPEGSMLDALVARVPGAELMNDGTIFMNGRKVDYLTLNGKDFYKGKNRIMLDNLPYYVVSHLKFYEKDMPISQMIHSDTGKKDYVMDVELKQEYSIGYNGNVEAGIGTHERWMARMFGLRFTDNSRIVLFAGANNTNEVRPPGTDGWHAQSKIATGNKEKEMAGGSLYIDDKNGKYNENLEVLVNWTKEKYETRMSKETYMIGDQAYTRTQDIIASQDFGCSLSNKLDLKKLGLIFDTNGSYYKKNGNGFSRKGSFLSSPSEYGSCIQILDSIFSTTVNPLLNNININKVIDQTKCTTSEYGLNQSINWDKSLPWGDDVSLFARADYNIEDKEDFSLYKLSYPEQSGLERNRYQPYHNKGYAYEVQGAYYLHIPNNWNFVVSSQFSQHYSNTKNPLYRLDWLDDDADFGMLPSYSDYLKTMDASNSYKNLYLTKKNVNCLNINHNFEGEKSTCFVSITVPVVYHKESVRHWRNCSRSDLSKSRWYLEPNVRIEYKLQNENVGSYWLEYKNNVHTSNLVQMLDFEDTVDPLSIKKGNPNLQPSRNHHFELHMDNGNWQKFYYVEFAANIIENMIANSFTYNPLTSVYTYRPENVNGNWNAEAKSSYNTYLDKNKYYRFEGKTSFNYVHNVDHARNEGLSASYRNCVDHYITSQQAIGSYNRNSLRIDLGANFAWNAIIRNLDNVGNTNAFDFSYGISGQYNLPWKIQFSTSLKMYSRRGYTDYSMNSDELIWNASATKTLLQGALLVKVEGFDMLSQRSTARYMANGQGRTEIWQMTMPAYAMLRVAYKFNKNPKKK